MNTIDKKIKIFIKENHLLDFDNSHDNTDYYTAFFKFIVANNKINIIDEMLEENKSIEELKTLISFIFKFDLEKQKEKTIEILSKNKKDDDFIYLLIRDTLILKDLKSYEKLKKQLINIDEKFLLDIFIEVNNIELIEKTDPKNFDGKRLAQLLNNKLDINVNFLNEIFEKVNLDDFFDSCDPSIAKKYIEENFDLFLNKKEKFKICYLNLFPQDKISLIIDKVKFDNFILKRNDFNIENKILILKKILKKEKTLLNSVKKLFNHKKNYHLNFASFLNEVETLDILLKNSNTHQQLYYLSYFIERSLFQSNFLRDNNNTPEEIDKLIKVFEKYIGKKETENYIKKIRSIDTNKYKIDSIENLEVFENYLNHKTKEKIIEELNKDNEISNKENIKKKRKM